MKKINKINKVKKIKKIKQIKETKETKKTEKAIKEMIRIMTKILAKIIKRVCSVIFLPFLFFLLFLILLLCLLFVSGCTSMGSKFDCNISSGGGCISMKEINRMADYGTFDDSYTYKKDKKYKKVEMSNTRDAKGNKFKQGRDKKNGNFLDIDSFGVPSVRGSESIQQIWIGPYKDTDGNYHGPAYVYTAVKKAFKEVAKKSS